MDKQPHSSIPYMSPQAVNALNEELRKDRFAFALPDNSGHVMWQMSAQEYWYWVWKNPDLGASDPQIAREAWRKFLNTELGQRYKVNPREGQRMALDARRDHRIIVK